VTPPVLDQQAPVPGALTTAAFGVVGVCTTIIYVLMIRRGLLDRRTALPVLAVMANVSWELTYAFVYPVYPQMRITLFAWLPLDLVLLWLAIRFGRKDFRDLSRSGYTVMLIGWAVFALSFIILATREFNDTIGAYTTVFDVVFMEAMFIVTLRARGSTAGQSMYIAILKTIVDAAGGLGLIVWYPNRFLLHQMIGVELVLDITYAVLLYRRFRAENASPWRKV
jgi:hypothetical protein